MGRALRSIVDQQSSAKGASKVLKKLLRLTQMDIDEIIGELEMDDYVLEEKGVLEYMALLNFEFQHINVGSLLKKGTCVLHDKSRHGKISCDGMPDKKLLAEVVSLIDSHIKQIGNASMRKCQEEQGGKARAGFKLLFLNDSAEWKESIMYDDGKLFFPGNNDNLTKHTFPEWRFRQYTDILKNRICKDKAKLKQLKQFKIDRFNARKEEASVENATFNAAVSNIAENETFSRQKRRAVLELLKEITQNLETDNGIKRHSPRVRTRNVKDMDQQLGFGCLQLPRFLQCLDVLGFERNGSTFHCDKDVRDMASPADAAARGVDPQPNPEAVHKAGASEYDRRKPAYYRRRSRIGRCPVST